MGIKVYKPTTAGLRNATGMTFDEITKTTPERALTVKLSKTGGRNNQGHITCRHIGGGHKRTYRLIDFKRNKDGIIGRVQAIEYDPNRSSNIALISYADGEKKYIIAPKGLAVGTEISSGTDVDIKVGNALPLANIPEGTFIHNVELQPGRVDN